MQSDRREGRVLAHLRGLRGNAERSEERSTSATTRLAVGERLQRRERREVCARHRRPAGRRRRRGRPAARRQPFSTGVMCRQQGRATLDEWVAPRARARTRSTQIRMRRERLQLRGRAEHHLPLLVLVLALLVVLMLLVVLVLVLELLVVQTGLQRVSRRGARETLWGARSGQAREVARRWRSSARVRRERG